MITQLDIFDKFFEILNVTSLTNIIDGGIYKLKKPQNSELQDIVINSLPLKSDHFVGIQNGTININCYCKNINGQPDTLTLKAISDQVLLLLEAYPQGTRFLNYDIEDMQTFQELQQNSMSFFNFKINIHLNK